MAGPNANHQKMPPGYLEGNLVIFQIRGELIRPQEKNTEPVYRPDFSWTHTKTTVLVSFSRFKVYKYSS